MRVLELKVEVLEERIAPDSINGVPGESNGNPGNEVRVLQAGTRSEAIEAMQAEVARLETQQQYLADERRQVQIVSPASGVVTTSKPKEKVGQHVERGDLIVEVFDVQRVR